MKSRQEALHCIEKFLEQGEKFSLCVANPNCVDDLLGKG